VAEPGITPRPFKNSSEGDTHMKALLINPEDQTIEAVEVDDIDAIRQLVGYDTLESDTVGGEGDRLYFDEECFIRGSKGRFQIDSVIPVAGKGVLVGSAGESLADVRTSIDDLRGRIRFQ
jgi:hypothetical protein